MTSQYNGPGDYHTVLPRISVPTQRDNKPGDLRAIPAYPAWQK